MPLGDLFGSSTWATSLLNAGLSGGAKSVGSFVSQLTGQGDSIAGGLVTQAFNEVNPYGKQNVLSRMLGRPDPLLACDWIAVVQSSTSPLGWEYIDTFSAPEMSIETHQHLVNAVSVHTASNRNIGNINLGLYTDRAALSINWALSWFRSTHRPDGFFGLPSTYKRDIVLYMLDQQRKTVVDFMFHGCVPTNYGAYDLGADSNLLTTTLTLSVDDVSITSSGDLSTAIQQLTTGALFGGS